MRVVTLGALATSGLLAGAIPASRVGASEPSRDSVTTKASARTQPSTTFFEWLADSGFGGRAQPAAAPASPSPTSVSSAAAPTSAAPVEPLAVPGPRLGFDSCEAPG